MCANNQTYAAVTGIRTDADRDALEKYRRMMGLAVRATMFGDSDAEHLAEQARKFAHTESARGNIDPLVEHLTRAVGIE